MKPLYFSLCLACLGGLFSGSHANAGGFAGHGGFGYPFVPFGFYQPYGAFYGTSLRTPPYFALNPPVYYGKRYTRPYGLSPFAAPPMMDAPAGYQGQAAPRFVTPPANPYVIDACAGGCAESGSVGAGVVVKKGEIRTNPFVSEAAKVASR